MNWACGGKGRLLARVRAARANARRGAPAPARAQFESLSALKKQVAELFEVSGRGYGLRGGTKSEGAMGRVSADELLNAGTGEARGAS